MIVMICWKGRHVHLTEVQGFVRLRIETSGKWKSLVAFTWAISAFLLLERRCQNEPFYISETRHNFRSLLQIHCPRNICDRLQENPGTTRRA